MYHAARRGRLGWHPAYISGEQKFACAAVLVEKHLDHAGAQNVSGMNKTEGDSISQLFHLAKRDGLKQ